MNYAGLQMRCQRCGAEMEMRDPGEGTPWTPDQFWVCNKCGRHFWTTYPPPKAAAPPAPAPAAVPPAAPAAPADKPAP